MQISYNFVPNQQIRRWCNSVIFLSIAAKAHLLEICVEHFKLEFYNLMSATSLQTEQEVGIIVYFTCSVG